MSLNLNGYLWARLIRITHVKICQCCFAYFFMLCTKDKNAIVDNSRAEVKNVKDETAVCFLINIFTWEQDVCVCEKVCQRKYQVKIAWKLIRHTEQSGAAGRLFTKLLSKSQFTPNPLLLQSLGLSVCPTDYCLSVYIRLQISVSDLLLCVCNL